MASQENVQATMSTRLVTATTTLQPSFEQFSSILAEKFVGYLDYMNNIPGGTIVLRYIKSSYKNDPVRSLFELCLFILACNYFLSSKKKENRSDILDFSEREIDELCRQWEPVPLVEKLTPQKLWDLRCMPEIKGHNGAMVQVTTPHIGKHVHAVNLASFDFLNLNESEAVLNAAKLCILTCGVGSCGPPNFYGTQDVHVRLEEDLSEYLDTEQAILYGQDFITAGSVIAAFLKRGDLCVVDSGINLALQKALVVSRCDIEWYDHNDMDHLEHILSELSPILDKQKPIRRRFIVTEALFSNYGDIANLPKIVELKNKYKYRLFLDETLSIGVLGDTGKGLPEYYGVPRSEIAITIGSLALSFAASGGFCVGVTPMIHHQRISSLAYVFSASLPPFSAKSASSAIKEITTKTNPQGKSVLISSLHEKTSYLYNQLKKTLTNGVFSIISSPESPIIHLSLDKDYRKRLNLPIFYGNTEFLLNGKPARKSNGFSQRYNLESYLLQKIIDEVLIRDNILLTRSKNTLVHENLPVANPHLLIMVNVAVSFEALDKLIKTLENISREMSHSIRNPEDLQILEQELLTY